MAEFKSFSTWRKAAFLMTHIAFLSFLVALVSPGWARSGPGLLRCDRKGNCNRSWYAPTEAFETLGYICLMPALVLIQCIVLLDEVKDNRMVRILFIALSLAAGIFVFLGDAIYISQINSFPIGDTVTILTSFELVASAVFGVLDLMGVKLKKPGK